MTALLATALTGSVTLLGNATPAAAGARASPPPPLSADTAPASIASTYGSGSFGSWAVDARGLPIYRYGADEQTDPAAKQPELAGATIAQHQIGNDNIKGMAFNDGYTQLWSQQRLAQWANLYEPTSQHYAGGYGYLRVGGRVLSMLYPDRPTEAAFSRDFGIGYYRRQLRVDGVSVTETTYAPFGSDPLLLDDVTITNTSAAVEHASWFEYWDVNPYDQALGAQRNLAIRSPDWDAAARTLSVGQLGRDAGDTNPLSIFAAALRGPVSSYETSTPAFFGSGSRAKPREVAADRLSDSIAPPSAPGAPGRTLFVLRSPVTLAPGQTVTLRYGYGLAHPSQIGPLVARYRKGDPLGASGQAWAAWLPKASFGPHEAWVARELEWDAYLLRSATVYEELCGEHTVTQGGLYQYSLGENLGYRSWLHYALPLTYTDPGLVRQIISYAIKLQPPGNHQLPYGTGQLCKAFNLGTSDDLDFWLLLASSEYGLATRDTRFFDQRLPFYGTHEQTTIWQHLRLAFQHQESLLGAHGDYLSGTFGDWSDEVTSYEHLTESTLVIAQLAYVYPRLAQLADLRGDHRFAAQLRASGARDLATLRGQWTGRGWYSRGYAGAALLGGGVIFEEPQPWAILAGAPGPSRAKKLVANIRRFLDGVGAPASTHGPAQFGTAMVPSDHDPGAREAGLPGALAEQAAAKAPDSPLAGAAAWPGGVWFDLNGWLTWSYGQLDGTLPGARTLAWNEYTRNTLANHAAHWPDHWDGTISVDDVCNAYYSTHPSYCGTGLGTTYEGQVTEQPTWMVMDAIRLAGVTPVEDGYQIVPHLPMATFSLRFPDIGVAASRGLLRGYVVLQRAAALRMRVAAPGSTQTEVFAHGRRIPSTRHGGLITFILRAAAGRPADWVVVAVARAASHAYRSTTPSATSSSAAR